MSIHKNLEGKLFDNAKKHIIGDEPILDAYDRELLTYYRRAVEETEDRIRALYSRFAKDNNMTKAEAEKLITKSEYRMFRMSLKDYMNQISEDGLNSDTAKELNILAMKSRISREERLLANIYMDMGRMANYTESEREDMVKEVMKTTFIRGSYDLQKTLGIYNKIDYLPEREIKKLIKHPWSVRTFSQSLWGHVDTLNKHIKEVVTDGFIQGKSVDKMVKSLKERTDVADYAVRRLVRTECKYFANQGEFEAYRANGIEKYVFIGGTSHKFKCQCMDLNGTVVKLEDARPGINFPPMHPNCKCCVRPYFDNSILDNNKGTKEWNGSLKDWKNQYFNIPELDAFDKKEYNKRKREYREFSTASETNHYFYETDGYKEWKNSLETNEIDYIEFYTGDGYKEVNPYNRKTGDWAADGKFGKIEDKIDEVLRKAGPKPERLQGESRIAYKRRLDKEWVHHDYVNARKIRDEVEAANINLNHIIENFNLEEDVIVYRGVEKDALPEFNKLTDLIGQVYSDKSYMSTAPVLASGFKKEYNFKIKVPKGKGRGAYLEELTKNHGEQEFLMKKNSKFMIQSVKHEAGMNYIEMELIP